MVLLDNGHGHRPVSRGNADIPPARGLYVRVAVRVVARRSGRVRRRSVDCSLIDCFSASKSRFHQPPPSVIFQSRQTPVHRHRALLFRRPELPHRLRDIDAFLLRGVRVAADVQAPVVSTGLGERHDPRVPLLVGEGRRSGTRARRHGRTSGPGSGSLRSPPCIELLGDEMEPREERPERVRIPPVMYASATGKHARGCWRRPPYGGSVVPSAWYSTGASHQWRPDSMYMTDRNRIDFEEKIVEVFGRRNCQPD